MSLNGLDDVKVKEAHEAAVAEAGGWYVNSSCFFPLLLWSLPQVRLAGGRFTWQLQFKSLMTEGAYTGSCSNTPVAMRSTS